MSAKTLLTTSTFQFKFKWVRTDAGEKASRRASRSFPTSWWQAVLDHRGTVDPAQSELTRRRDRYGCNKGNVTHHYDNYHPFLILTSAAGSLPLFLLTPATESFLFRNNKCAFGYVFALLFWVLLVCRCMYLACDFLNFSANDCMIPN